MNRIFIISHHLMFGYGLESLLRQETELNIIGWETNITQGLQMIKELQPDVVILDRDDSAFNFTAELLHILNNNPGVKVICLNLRNNNLHIYQAHQRVATGFEDLVETIKDEQPVPAPQQIAKSPWSQELMAQLGDFPLKERSSIPSENIPHSDL
jgi:DNA-binding NarL/FixJ family response regulator